MPSDNKSNNSSESFETVSSEQCKPTTPDYTRPTHFVRRGKRKEVRSAVIPARFKPGERDYLFTRQKLIESASVNISEGCL